MKQMQVDRLAVEIYETRAEMGKAAARDIAAAIAKLLDEKSEIYMIFAAAPSQNEVLQALTEDKSIAWERIHAYHMDEYIGLPKGAMQSFGVFLREHLFDRVPFRSVQYIDSTARDPYAESERYGALLREHPADIVVMGIGENGHIAFNDPPVADFRDPATVKPVELDAVCRNQQVNDGCFARLEDVPTHAITLTVPTLTAAPHLFCIVPAATKANAVYETLHGSIDAHCPASILRTHACAKLYLDAESAKRL